MTTSTHTVTQVTQDPSMLTVADVVAIRQEALDAAKTAALKHLDTVGENMYCGFAWVNIYGVKGNTKLGKTLKAAGIEQSYDKSYQMWNPSGVGTQCMLTKEVGAQAAADVFVKYGFRSYMGSRAD